MQSKVIKKLLQVNKEFYKDIAVQFDKTRQSPWNEWRELLSAIKEYSKDKDKLNILDVGCGNGRFAHFLKNNLSIPFSYTGTDSNEYLIEKAKETLPKNYIIEVEDLLESSFIKSQNKKYDFIFIIATLHHIPAFTLRSKVMKIYSQFLKEDGEIIFSVWDFLSSEKLQRKLIAFDEIGINKSEVEKGDYLMNWRSGKDAIRYVHHFEDLEIEKLCEDSKIKILDKFSYEESDNVYYFLRK